MSAFKPGQSGNPAGRPPGVADKRTALRELLVPHAEALVTKAVELALNGDSTALRICVDRLIPAAKPKDAPIAMPTLRGTLAEQGLAVLDALAAGEITPDEAATIMQAVGTHARIIEVDELERRVAALEAGKP